MIPLHARIICEFALGSPKAAELPGVLVLGFFCERLLPSNAPAVHPTTIEIMINMPMMAMLSCRRRVCTLADLAVKFQDGGWEASYVTSCGKSF